MDPGKPTPSLNELLKMGNNVKVYHLPSYAKYDPRHNPNGSRTLNPLSPSRLCANPAVANTDPKDVQRFVGQNRPQFRASNVEDPNQVKDLVKKLEKYQSPLEDTESYVRKELAKYKYRDQHPDQEEPVTTAYADNVQGALGDCWLMAGLANITSHPHYFDKVVPRDQSYSEDFAGIFHFRFWQFGEWVDVVVDDFLPTKYGRLIYLKSDNTNEFWTALVEKAYAKLYGSYEALKGGKSIDAMIDFTGGIGETFNVKETSEDIFGIMMKAYNRVSMMSCSKDSAPGGGESKTMDGLVQGHAYSVTKVALVELDSGDQVALVRVRNPWGDEFEWKGPWSDESEEWASISEEEKERLGVAVDKDGEFYIALNDFIEQFDSVEICSVPSDGIAEDDESGKITWHETNVHGAWVEGSTAGGCINDRESFSTNPQYKIVLEDSDEDEDDLCTFIVSIIQKGTRGSQCTRGKNSCLSIGFSVYHLEDPSEVELPLNAEYFGYHRQSAESGTFINSRQVSARFKLPPGSYVIIPSTFRSNEEGEFLLRVIAEHPAPIQAVQE